MAFKIKTTLSNLKKRIKILANRKKLLLAAGDVAETELIKNWNSALGGDGLPMPKLKDKYKKWKVRRGGLGVRNIKLNGVMRKSLTRKISGVKIVIGFTKDQKLKAKGNLNHAPNMMHTSEKMAQLMSETMVNVLQGKNK